MSREDPLQEIVAISTRNHVVSLEDLVAAYAKTPDQIQLLLRFGRHLLSEAASAYSKACANALQQAGKLIEDPGYFEVKKRRRNIEMNRSYKEAEDHRKSLRQQQIDRIMNRISGVPQ